MNVVQAFDQLILQCYKKVDRRVKWHEGYQIYFYMMKVLVCFCDDFLLKCKVTDIESSK